MTRWGSALFVQGQRLRRKALRALARVGVKDEYFLILLSIVIGAATGIGAHFFFMLIEFAGELAYGSVDEGHGGGLYAGRLWMLVLLPTAGALVVGHLTYFFAREAKGHGVPEVMDAMYRGGGKVRPRIALAKSITSALTIGSGGSAGTEGPIVQIGAAIGSSMGQVFHMHPRNMGIVVACGVSAGIAAIFNAPIAGVMFALEIFLKDFSFRVFSPVVFASVISCSIMHALKGDSDVAIFEVAGLRAATGEAGHYLFAATQLPFFLVLGLLCALGAVLFIRALYATEDLCDKIRIPEPLKPALGAILLGLTGIAYVVCTGRAEMPPFFGNGYAAIETALGRGLLEMSVGTLFAIFLLKMLATCFTLGSGGSGGVFAPSLLLGASLGGAFGVLLHQIGWVDDRSVAAYALVGMAAMVAGTTHAPLTAIVMLYEITREPKAVLPVMFAAIVAMLGAQLLLRDSIYTLKLRRRGVRVGSSADLTILRRISASDVQRQDAPFVLPDDPLQKLIDLAARTDATDFVVVDEQGVYQGLVTGRDIRTALLEPEAVSLLLVGELVREGVPTVAPHESLDIVLDKFSLSETESLPLCSATDSTHIDGLITRHAAMRAYQQELNKPLG